MVYSNMMYAGVVPYIVMINLADSGYVKIKYSKFVCCAGIALITFLCFFICNRAYANQEAVLSLEKSYANRVAMRIELMKGYDEDTEVYFANPISYDAYPVLYSQLDTTDNFSSFIYNDNGMHQFMLYYLGIDLNSVTDVTKIDQILSCSEFEEMPCYPAEGSLKYINNILVVKFKDGVWQ